MKRFATASALLGVIGSVGLAVAADLSSLPSPWQHQDIGAVEVKGSASEANGVFTLQGTLDIWGNSDGCHYAWKPHKGDILIIARVLSVENTQGHAKGGLAIRESLSADSRHVTMVDTPADGTQFLIREESGGKTTVQRTSLNKGTMPYWIKLVRAGDTFSGFESVDGKSWTQTGTTTLKLPESIHVGLVASSHVKDKLCTVKLDQVSISKDAK